MSANEEISLYDIYAFFRDGWKTLAVFTVLGLLAGLVVSFVLPVKYQANALIDSARVGFVSLERGVDSRELEPLGVLAQRMQAPGFYSEETIDACGLRDKASPRRDLVDELAPSIARNGSFISIGYRSESIDLAKQCLQSVLADVSQSQRTQIEAVKSYLQTEIKNTRAQLADATSARDAERADRDASLSVARQQLLVAREELKALDEAVARADAGDTALGAIRVLTKRGEVQELESMLLALQSNFSTSASDVADKINRLTNRLAALEAAAQFPSTREASFATPIFASDSKVSPRRGLIIVASVLLGGFVGFMLLIVIRARRYIRAQEATQRG